MNISFNSLSGFSCSSVFNPSATIYDVECYLKTQLPAEEQEFQLYYNRIPLGPNTEIKDLNVKENDYILIRAIKDNEKEKKPLTRKKIGLPPREELRIPENDPDNFDEDVATLMEMGFNRADCERALRMSFYNLDRASYYLANGNIPSRIGPEVNMDKFHSNKADVNEKDLQIIEEIIAETGEEKAIVVQTYLCFEKNAEKTIKCLLNED